MRIAVVSTVYRPTPPTGYGGIERVVHTFVQGLARAGHDVVLFGRRGSRGPGRTIEVAAYDETPLRSGVTAAEHALSEEPLYEAMAAELAANPVDVVHDWSFENLFVTRHPERFPFVVSTCIPLPAGKRAPNLVACSRAHAESVGPGVAHVHYGLDLTGWDYTLRKGRRAVHIAKVARYKGQHDAILASRASGLPLDLVGNVEDRAYHALVVRPLVALSPTVRYLGESDGARGPLRNARALVQTPRWFDAFPFVVLEALASAVPVVSYAQGGTVEQIVPGVTGFLANTRADLAEGMARVDEIAPRACREYAEEHFGVSRMVRDYERLYARALDGESW